MQERRRPERFLLNLGFVLRFVFSEENEQRALFRLIEKFSKQSFDSAAVLS